MFCIFGAFCWARTFKKKKNCRPKRSCLKLEKRITWQNIFSFPFMNSGGHLQYGTFKYYPNTWRLNICDIRGHLMFIPSAAVCRRSVGSWLIQPWKIKYLGRNQNLTHWNNWACWTGSTRNPCSSGTQHRYAAAGVVLHPSEVCVNRIKEDVMQMACGANA